MERRMTYARVTTTGIEVRFFDGATGIIPFTALEGEIQLSSSYMVNLEILWDFARHYCDPEYKPKERV